MKCWYYTLDYLSVKLIAKNIRTAKYKNNSPLFLSRQNLKKSMRISSGIIKLKTKIIGFNEL